MEQKKLNIDDGSGDRDYFTIIPNYILNHSIALDQALYAQLKRLSGEKKKNYCYPSFRYLKKQLKVGEITLKKAFKYLIDKKWIDDLGKRRVMTRGGYQWVNCYKINDIWKLNTEYYQGVSNQRHPEENKVSPEQSKVSPEMGKVSPVIGAKEERKKELLKKDIILHTEAEASGKEINNLIFLFKQINPSYEQLFKRKNQRDALIRLLKKMGREQLEKAISTLEITNTMPFSPTITTPIQLEEKMGALIAFIKKEKVKIINKKPTIAKVK